jgi:hypothetical protein
MFCQHDLRAFGKKKASACGSDVGSKECFVYEPSFRALAKINHASGFNRFIICEYCLA